MDNLATGVVPGYQMDDETVRTPALFRVGGLLFVKYVLQELVDSFDTGIVPGWRLAGYHVWNIVRLRLGLLSST